MKRILMSMVLVLPLFVSAQRTENEVISQKIEGHIFKPKEIKPTDEHIRSIKVPDGFTVTKFAEEVGKPRMIRVSRSGNVYVTDRDSGIVTLLRDGDGDGKAERKTVVFRKKGVHGIDIVNDDIYLVTVKEVYKGKLAADGRIIAIRTIITGLPDGGQHANRTIKVGPDNKLYITVGSTCNACEETSKESATIVQTDLNGKGRTVYAKGLRNTIGFDWHPQTGELFGFDHGIDWLGDNEQREELNRIVKGADYGWPYIFESGKPNKADQPKNMTYEQYAAKTTFPQLLYTAHAAPMNFLFYNENQFPSEFRGHAFATMHGSWNRETPSGYNVVLVKFENGKAASIEEFASGFLVDGNKAYFARPCGLAVHRDGSLLMTDDAMGVVYRISYGK